MQLQKFIGICDIDSMTHQDKYKIISKYMYILHVSIVIASNWILKITLNIYMQDKKTIY